MKSYRCAITGEQLDTNQVTKTEDNVWVRIDFYARACKYHKKGLLTLNEIEEYVALSKRFIRVLRVWLKFIAYDSWSSDTDYNKVYGIYAKALKELAIKHYNKHLETLELDEHTKLLEQVTKTYPKLVNVPNSLKDSAHYYTGVYLDSNVKLW